MFSKNLISISREKELNDSRKKGFTLIELLVVIAIIGLLSSIVLVSLQGARARARDARRMHDLSQIRTALQLYFDAKGNFIETGSGCGINGDGTGWFNYTGGSYPKSIVQCLIDEGFLRTEIIDPTGGRTTGASAGYAYMKYHCTLGGKKAVFVYAVLETKPRGNVDTTATDGTCCSGCDSSYGMNYYLRVE